MESLFLASCVSVLNSNFVSILKLTCACLCGTFVCGLHVCVEFKFRVDSEVNVYMSVWNICLRPACPG